MNALFAAQTTKNGSVAVTKQGLPRNQLIRIVAAAVASHNMRNLGGIDRIEDLPLKEVDELPVAGTLFEVVSNELQVCGIETDGTVGAVMEALGFKRGSAQAAHYAHEIGCHCHGQFISPSIGSQRILNLIDATDSA